MSTKETTHQYRLNKWTEIIRECRSSGQTISEWCAAHNVSQNSYFYWLKRIREAACKALPSIGAASNTIVPVTIPELTQETRFSSKDKVSTPDIILSFRSISIEIYNH